MSRSCPGSIEDGFEFVPTEKSTVVNRFEAGSDAMVFTSSPALL
jgi:Tfp pilus assembly pilus retraction ATPase PilT